MRILLIGDSITDMQRNKQVEDFTVQAYGNGYPFFVEGELSAKAPGKYKVINRGISGNRIVDLYARIKVDCWNLKPDVISILIGVNDVWHGLEDGVGNGVEIDRFEKVYRMFIEDTLKKLPNVKFMLLEPFVLEGTASFDKEKVPAYARVVEKLAAEYNFVFVPLQNVLLEKSQKYGMDYYLYDGVHPSVAGAKLISEEWLRGFDKIQ